jgi:hypothetical protein
MHVNLLSAKGTPIEKQHFTWKELVPHPISKLDDDAFTRVRIVLMNGIEAEAVRFGHMAARFNADLRLPLALVRRAEHHQQTMINWLLGSDHSPLETTIGYEQVAIEVTAAVAQNEPDDTEAGLPLRAARGLRPPVSLRGAARPARRQGRQQHPAEPYRHPAGPAHRRGASGAGRRPARALPANADPLSRRCTRC